MSSLKSIRVAMLVVCGVAAVSACAKSPESIAPSYVSQRIYNDLDCSQLAEEQMNVSSALTVASQQQSDARTNDVVGVLLLGLPVSTLSGGNVAYQVADLKGQQVAIQKAMVQKRCSTATAHGAGHQRGDDSASYTEVSAAVEAADRPAGVKPLPSAPDVADPVNYSADEILAYCRAGWETRRLTNGKTEYNPCFYQ